MTNLIKWSVVYLFLIATIYVVFSVYNSSWFPFDWSRGSKIFGAVLVFISCGGVLNNFEEGVTEERRIKRQKEKNQEKVFNIKK